MLLGSVLKNSPKPGTQSLDALMRKEKRVPCGQKGDMRSLTLLDSLCLHQALVEDTRHESLNHQTERVCTHYPDQLAGHRKEERIELLSKDQRRKGKQLRNFQLVHHKISQEESLLELFTF